MAGMIDAYEVAVLDYITSAAGTTVSPTNWFVALFTTSPNEAGSGQVEVSGGAYARVSMASTDWAIAAAGAGGFPSTVDNSTATDFITATASWGTVISFGLFAAATGGTPQWWGTLDASKVVDNGDSVSFAIGTLILKLGDPADSY